MNTITLRTATVLIGVALTSSLAALRTFPDVMFLADAALLLGVGVLLPTLLRGVRLPTWCWVTVTVVATGLTLIGRHLGDTTWWGLPTGHTVSEAREVWVFAGENLSSARPPVPYAGEWGLLFSTAFAVTILVASIVAFALRSPRWALVPFGALFSMFIVFGRGDGATLLAAGFIVVMLAALAALAPGARRLPLANGAGRRLGRTVGLSGTLLVATVVGVVVGPVAPGTDSDAWIPVRGRSAGALLFDHPIVDVRGRLVDQSTIEMFQVISDQPSYWRLASLAEFDGVTFTVPRRQLFRLDLDPTASAGATLRHEVVIGQLPGRLVPVAPEPVLLNRRDVRFNPDTGSLVTSRLLDEGDRFVIASAPPELDAAQLMGPATASAGPVPDPVHTALPIDLPATVTATAQLVVEAWGLNPDLAVLQPYVTALALQDWFRSRFDYRLDVTYGRDGSAIAEFLEQREGYCEQFAIAFAVMARTLGIPARVAVGFTPGERLPDGAWSVQGRHSHAWPELWFAEVGWVGFEPTPGRGAPGAELYTGVAAAQDGDANGDGSGDGTGDGDEFEPGAAPGDGSNISDDLLDDLDQLLDVPLGDITIDGSSADDSSLSVVRTLVRTLAVAVVALLGAGPLLVRWLRNHRRRQRGVADVVAELWPRVHTWLLAARVPVTSSMTPREVMALTARRHPDVAQAMAPLVSDVEGAVFAAPGTRVHSAKALLAHVATVRRLLSRKRRVVDRVADYLRPWRD